MTQKLFLENVYVGLYVLDSRVRKLVPHLIYMIKNLTLCEEQWTKMSQEQREKALSVDSDKLSKDYNFKFAKKSNEIDLTKKSHWMHFTAHNMFRCMVNF